MAILDWVFIAVLVASLMLGAWRGLVYEVLSVMSWIAAFVLAQWLAPDVASRLPMGSAAEPVRYAAGFVVVLVAAAFAGGCGRRWQLCTSWAGARKRSAPATCWVR